MNIVNNNYNMVSNIHTKCGILIIYEAQDMKPYYMQFVHKIVHDLQIIPRVCILGDAKQSIYKYNEADERFITCADRICMFNTLEWKKLKLSKSYRITTQMADFINHCALNENRLIGNGDGPKVKYFIAKDFKQQVDEVIRCIDKYGSERIFILSPSVRMPPPNEKGRISPLKMLVNILSKRGYNFYVPNSDDEDLKDEDILKAKIVLSTFHQAKGLERDVVIIYGFDLSYFQYYNKDDDPNTCPNPMYVALTRAKGELILIHNKNKEYLPFLNDTSIDIYCDVVGEIGVPSKPPIKDNVSYSVTSLIRHLPQFVENKCMELIKINNICPATYKLHTFTKVVSDETVEAVHDLLGTSIPAWIELGMADNRLDGVTIYKYVKEYLGKHPESIGKYHYEHFTKPFKIDINYINFVTVLYNAFDTKYMHRIKQIRDYKWITQNIANKAKEYTLNQISRQCAFEVVRIKQFDIYEITGRIDCIDVQNNAVYEFKCAREFKDIYYIQLALYQYLLEDNIATRKYYLYNILTGEKKEIIISPDNLNKLVKILIDNKITQKEHEEDEQFITSMRALLTGKKCEIEPGDNSKQEIDEEDINELMSELNL